MRNPFTFPRGSDAFHFALLARSFGGWYPVPGQLERCARGLFELVHEEDGTDDYRRTSEAWLGGVRRALHSPRREGPTRLIRIEGTNMDKVRRLSYERV